MIGGKDPNHGLDRVHVIWLTKDRPGGIPEKLLGFVKSRARSTRTASMFLEGSDARDVVCFSVHPGFS